MISFNGGSTALLQLQKNTRKKTSREIITGSGQATPGMPRHPAEIIF